MALYRMEAFENRFNDARKRSAEMVTAPNAHPGIQIKPLPGGTNIYSQQLSTEIDGKKCRRNSIQHIISECPGRIRKIIHGWPLTKHFFIKRQTMLSRLSRKASAKTVDQRIVHSRFSLPPKWANKKHSTPPWFPGFVLPSGLMEAVQQMVYGFCYPFQ